MHVEGPLVATRQKPTMKIVRTWLRLNIACFGILQVSAAAAGTPPSDLTRPTCASQVHVLAASKFYPQFTNLLATHLEGLTRSEAFSGVVLVVHRAETVFLGAYGCANREKRVPNTASTKFRIGSMNKMFTAIAIFQLAEAGNLHLEDSLGRELTTYPNKDLAANATLGELLTHTAGAGDIFGPEFDAHRRDLQTLEDYAKRYGSRGPSFSPGSRYSYSNYGFVLLGLVVEKTAGQDYYDYIRTHIFAPAGMTATGSLPENVPVPERSVGYTRQQDSQEWKRNTETLPFRGTSAGGGYSTVGDLLRFHRALWRHRLLTALSVDAMTSGKVDTDWPGIRYGYGFMETVKDGVRWVGHEGGAPGMNGEYWTAPDTGYALIALSNLDPPSATAVVQWMAPRLPH